MKQSNRLFVAWAVPALLLTICTLSIEPVDAMLKSDKKRYSEEVKEIFDHAYGAYMANAYPADELMPLSCKGRVRGVDASRGDIDEALGNFSLTLVDTLDALAVVGHVDEFIRAVGLVIANVKFDADFVVSVFETNIRVLGGLLGAHTVMLSLKEDTKLRAQYPALDKYNGELVQMSLDLGSRLLLAFDSATGIPYSRINLRYGLNAVSRQNQATCTACAGTMLLEFGALSRFSGDPKFEQAARRAMEALWSRRAVHTELVGETINVTSGAWSRTDSGIGAGIDSYYEYLLKSYILFGDETYFTIFKLQYDAVMKSLRQGPFIFHANMYQPNVVVRRHLDSLQMFWPGLQVLHGDLTNAKDMHRMHFELAQRYDFSPEGYTPEFNVHWGNWPLRPEFIESTFFLYKATKDPFYLEVGKQMVDDLKEFTKVECGFAAISDVRKKSHEDKMDSFFLAETVKYLYLLFTEPEDLVLNMDDFVFTTEAHLLPLTLSQVNLSFSPFEPVKAARAGNTPKPTRAWTAVCTAPTHSWTREAFLEIVGAAARSRKCVLPPYEVHAAAANKHISGATKKVVGVKYDRRKYIAPEKLNVSSKSDLLFLQSMGIFVEQVEEGYRLIHHSNLDGSQGKGLEYMKRLVQAQADRVNEPRMGTAAVRFGSPEQITGGVVVAGQASFGTDLEEHDAVFGGSVAVASPFTACTELENADDLGHKVVLVQRGDCMFVDKVRIAQSAGAEAVIVVDNRPLEANAKLFTMSGDGVDDVEIPAVFVTLEDGHTLIDHISDYGDEFTVEIFSSKWEDDLEA
eukprot:m.121951 g.121951  ORF g.121951 m.121951 type:complete len:800 (+) comp13403_c2_seq1:180-2579(+)